MIQVVEMRIVGSEDLHHGIVLEDLLQGCARLLQLLLKLMVAILLFGLLLHV